MGETTQKKRIAGNGNKLREIGVKTYFFFASIVGNICYNKHMEAIVMGNTWKCLQCRKVIDRKFNKCDACGYMRYGKNNEYAPTAESYRMAREVLRASQKKQKRKKAKQSMHTDEEILALGLYPDDEGYKMSLISRILGK